ncbi:MAG: Cys-Gln thioester bond-forming surface protein [Actinobacteria bacterium]|nr:Cys-Gln thioester bond-forming surface protein [Actinomycetota bacterium]
MKLSPPRFDRRRILAVLAGFVVFLGGIGLSLATVDAASAVTPRNGPKGAVVHGILRGKPLTAQTILFAVDLNGAPSFMFCIDIDTAIEFGVAYSETDWSEAQVPNLAEVARVLSQTTATTSRDPVEIAAAQAAIWHFSDGFDLDVSSGKNHAAVVARYQALVADAAQNPATSEPAGTLDVSPDVASASYGQPVFFDVASTADGPIGIELSDSLVSAHPVSGEVCDTATTIATITAGARLCVTSASPRANVKITLRTQAAPLSAGRVFVRPNRQKLIIGKAGAAQSNESVTASWADNARPTVTVECPAEGVRFGVPATFAARANDPDNDALRYQWSVNGSPVEGANEALFTHAMAPGDDVRVTVTDAVGQSASADVNCSTNTTPVALLACPTQVILGAENTFSAGAEGVEGASVRFEWALNGTVVAGVEGPTFTTVVNAGDDVRVRVIAPSGNASEAVVASCIPTEVNEAPEVTLNCPDSVPVGGGSMTFVARGTDRNGDELTYTWFLNGRRVDGTAGAELTIDLDPGDIVGVEASDGTLASVRAEVDCVAPGINEPPVVSLSCPTTVVYGEPTVFTANGSDPDGDAIEYRWAVNGTVDDAQTGPQATFIVDAGDRLSVQAIESASGSTSAVVTVDCVGVIRPTVTITCPISLVAGEPATFIANGSDGTGQSALTYRWALNGVPLDGQLTARLVIAVQPTDRLTVSALSQDGVVSATASADCVSNSRPTVTLSCPQDLVFGEPAEFVAVGADADADADAASLVYEWRVDDAVIDGQTAATAILTIRRGARVSVSVVDEAGLRSEVATSTCVGTSTPTVRIECPASFHFGEPVVVRAVGEDGDGDSLSFRWSRNGEVVAGEAGPSITIALGAGDLLSVEALDPTATVSAAAAFDCDTGSTRPTVTLACAENVVFGTPVTVTASIAGVAAGQPVVYTWAVNGKVLDGETASTVTVVLKPDDVVAVTAMAGAHAVSNTGGTNCTSVAPTEVPQVPPTPEVLAYRVEAAAVRAVAASLATTGTDPARIVGVGLAVAVAGGFLLVIRRRLGGAN